MRLFEHGSLKAISRNGNKGDRVIKNRWKCNSLLLSLYLNVPIKMLGPSSNDKMSWTLNLCVRIMPTSESMRNCLPLLVSLPDFCCLQNLWKQKLYLSKHFISQHLISCYIWPVPLPWHTYPCSLWELSKYLLMIKIITKNMFPSMGYISCHSSVLNPWELLHWCVPFT